MQELIQQEKFELEVLDRLNTKRLLAKLVFGGGTMLRLCHGLNRFSVDLDFWLAEEAGVDKFYKELEDCLRTFYKITDCANKFFTILLELRAKDYPRSLKVEIRKEQKKVSIEQVIAYSKYSNQQVFLQAVSLKDMMKAKIEAFIERKETRDAFDIEFLLRRGIEFAASAKESKMVLKVLENLTKKDFSVKLGPLLEEEERKYYLAEGFKTLKAAAQKKGADHE